jgi:hypothetical protein
MRPRSAMFFLAVSFSATRMEIKTKVCNRGSNACMDRRHLTGMLDVVSIYFAGTVHRNLPIVSRISNLTRRFLTIKQV